MKPTGISVETVARLVGSPRDRYTLRLAYDVAAPLEVRATFSLGGASVDWVWGRDVLAAALDGPAGMDQVRMWPDGQKIYARLDGQEHDGDAPLITVVAMPRRDVERFLEQSARLVPYGQEVLCGLDRELAQLLGGAS